MTQWRTSGKNRKIKALVHKGFHRFSKRMKEAYLKYIKTEGEDMKSR